MQDNLLRLFAESPVTSVDDQASNSVYMTVTMRMLSTAPNGNGHVIQKDFIDEIIENQSWYVGTPVKADTERLMLGLKDRLGHKFNKARREYMTEQIGSILSFEAVEEDGETVLYGTARIEKSHKELVETIVEMYEEGILFFSFEIIASKFRREGDMIYVGADPDNRLTAMCIVSIPAYKEARAIRLVASNLEKEFMENVNSLSQWVSAELEVDDVRRKLYTMLFDADAPLLPGGWCWEVREFGVDYALVKHCRTGERMMVKYHVNEDEVIVDEIYAVELTRKAGHAAEPAEPVAAEQLPDEEDRPDEDDIEDPEDEEEEKEKDDALEAEQEQAEPESAEETAPVSDAEPAPAEEAAPVEAEQAPVNEELAAALRELEELRAFKAEVERNRIEAELEAKRAKLRAKVVRFGLDPEALSAEINALNYEAIFASLDVDEEQYKAETPAVNMMADENMALKGSKWAGYITDPTGLN